VALIAFLIWLLQSPPRPVLVLVGADPLADVERLDVPLDLYGWQGARQLAQWAADAASRDQSRWGKLAPEVFGADRLTPASLKAQQFREWAGHLAEGKHDPLIIYFGLYGAADANGPYLVTTSG